MGAEDSAGESHVGLQFSVYPLRQEHLHAAIEAAVQAATKAGLDVRVGQLSSFAPGDEEAVFAGLRAAFDAASSLGPTVMVVTLSSGLPSSETVAEIQDAARTLAAGAQVNQTSDAARKRLRAGIPAWAPIQCRRNASIGGAGRARREGAPTQPSRLPGA